MLTGKCVLITGVGIRAASYVYRDILTGEPSHTPLIHEETEYKVNIGAACALECARAGSDVIIVSRSLTKLEIIRSWILREVPDASIICLACDLTDCSKYRPSLTSLPTTKPLYWVHSVGLGAGTVQLENDNPYLLLEEIGSHLVEAELSVLKDTVHLFQTLLPHFRTQPETRVCILSSMSAVRSFWSGSIHNAAKAAISRFANAQMIEQAPHHIYITDIRPGAVDTGFYDPPMVRKRVQAIAETMGLDWSELKGGLRLMPPTSVGEIVATILGSKSHTTSVNLVARGQFPHEGS